MVYYEILDTLINCRYAKKYKSYIFIRFEYITFDFRYQTDLFSKKLYKRKTNVQCIPMYNELILHQLHIALYLCASKHINHVEFHTKLLKTLFFFFLMVLVITGKHFLNFEYVNNFIIKYEYEWNIIQLYYIIGFVFNM